MWKIKKIIFLIVIVLILVVGGGFFWWQQGQETPPEKWEAAKISPKEAYIIKETPEGKIVENKKVGLTFKIPKDWIVKKEDPTSFHSQDAEFSETRSDVLKKGCQIDILASNIKTNLAALEKYINENLSKWSPVIEVDVSQRIEISNYLALKHKYHVKQDRPDRIKMAYISIDIPAKEYLYKILLAAPLQETERCEKEFDNFLKTVSID